MGSEPAAGIGTHAEKVLLFHAFDSMHQDAAQLGALTEGYGTTGSEPAAGIGTQSEEASSRELVPLAGISELDAEGLSNPVGA